MLTNSVLLVEGEPNTQARMADALRSAGYSVDIAASAAQAKIKMARNHYNLVLAKWWLSNGERIADQAAGYILLTPEEAVCHELLAQPVQPSDLVDAVERFIGPPVEPRAARYG